jgi:cysteine desulfuration protein SufE
MSDVQLDDPLQQEIAEEFSFFGDWSERYQYLIDLGRKLPPFRDEWKTEANRLQGCQSLVWVVHEGDASALTFHAISDILATEPKFIEAIGLGKHLSVTRSNGLAALIAHIKGVAARALASAG